MNNKTIPLIKEYRIDKLKKCLVCIDKYPFNRDKQKNCILSLYSDKEGKDFEHKDKSIFRGMVVPSLGYLGLIIGHGDFIRVSANGKLIIESQKINDDLHNRVLRRVIYDIDQDIFQFLGIIKEYYSICLKEFIDINLIDAPSQRQKKERISRWLSILQQAELINYSSEKITINEEKHCQTSEGANIDLINIDFFERFLFDSYFQISKGSVGVVDITDLRKEVAIRMLKNKIILTENQFDNMLRKIPFETKDYIISFGKPMGAGERLFKYKENYFRTIFIKVHKM